MKNSFDTNATIVFAPYKNPDGSFTFPAMRSGKSGCFIVKGYQNGIVTIESCDGYDIHDFCMFIAGCLDDDSNFIDEVLNAYQLKHRHIFRAIRFSFNGATATIAREGSSLVNIYDLWERSQKTTY